jgi:hypothetical protein
VGEDLPWFHAGKPDTPMLIHLQSLHSGNLPLNPLKTSSKVPHM